jgi:predicted metal-dependent phosphoesterase TrpH
MTDARIDLHLHTTASDGTLTPGEIVLLAKKRGLAAIAITDHDTIGAVKDAMAAGEKHGIEVVPGTEIGIAHDPARHLIEIDILGYFIDPEHAELNEALEVLQKAKNDKLFKQLAMLAQNGYEIESSEVLAVAAGDTVRRPHIWKILREHYPDLRAEVFFEKTSFGGDWYVTKDFSLSLEASVDLIERAGGVPVIAHPGAYNETFTKHGELVDPDVDAAIGRCLDAGVKGIEVYYTYDKNRPFHDKTGSLISREERDKLIDHYASIARERGVLKTGGTDFHGANKPQIEVGEIEIPYHLLEELRAARPV